MRRFSISPRVQIIREATADAGTAEELPKYGGLFKKEIGCQTSETKVKEFKLVLNQLDHIKTVIRRNHRFKFK